MPQITEKIFYMPGERREILVAAPHHGYTPGCDYYTKEFAMLLASQLDAPLLFAEDLRPLVDLNKEPELASTPQLKELCYNYQEHALSAPVDLFLEIHGHIHGCYDLEISCGFELDPFFPLDKELGESLDTLQASLDWELKTRWQEREQRQGQRQGQAPFSLPRPSIGVFPFNRNVVMKATRTYLFQKIRELQLQGRRIFGIHIEVFSAYRTKDADSPEYACQAALVNALAQSVIKSFKLK